VGCAKRDESRIRSVEMKFARRVAGCTGFDLKKNVDLMNEFMESYTSNWK
jgi:hypothetical protein